MKKFFLLLLISLMAATLSAKELKVLMIGNSFSNSVKILFPKVVESGKKHTLILGSASIGGCTLQKHCANIDEEKKDPNYKKYRFTCTGIKESKQESMTYALKYKKWDIVTIQQASAHSFKKEMTREYAAKLIARIRELAPQAEIVIQQTWAWRTDFPTLRKSGGKLTQEIMYKGLVENYNEVAKTHKLRIIPVGTAVQLFREKLPVKPVQYTQAQIDALKEPAVLDLCGGDVVGWMRWMPDKKTKKKAPYNDAAHMNAKGNFLQACVWYMTLFDEPVTGIKYTIKDKKAMELILKCADEAVKQYKK